MKVVLVSIHVADSCRALPLGAAMIASVLKRDLPDRVSPRLADFTVERPPAECAREILALEPDCVGFSVYVWNRRRVAEIARALREERPRLVLFAGGAEATADPQGVREEAALDFVLPGEAEATVVAAMECLLSGRPPAGTIGSAERAFVADLSSLPSPYLDGTLDPARWPGLAWELSRGCPFACHYCYESHGRPGVRTFPEERLRAELELFAARGASRVFVLDPTFNADRRRAARLLSMMEEAAPGVRFDIEIRGELLDRRTAGLFASIDCSLQIGLQSADERVLANVGRTIDRSAMFRRVLLLHEAGAVYGFDLIYGLPGDTLQGFLASLDFAMSMAPNHVDIFPLAVLPGTRLASTAASFGLQHSPEAPYLVSSSPTFPPADLAEASRVAAAFDLFYNRGRAVPWFSLVLEHLELAPSEFFSRLARFLAGEDHGGADPAAVQREFLAVLFAEKGMSGLFPVVGDIVSYFGACGRLVEDGAGPLRVRFSHEPVSLVQHLSAGIRSLAELSAFVSRFDREALLKLDGEEVVIFPEA